MSGKKASSSTQGIKSFFTPKAESKMPDAVVCIDLLDEPSRTTNVKVNTFFLSKTEKKDLEAQERANRIREDLIRTKQETDRMLVSSTKEGSEPVNSGFFAARQSRPSYAKTELVSPDLREPMDSGADDQSQVDFLSVQHVGVQAELMLLGQQRARCLQNTFPKRSHFHKAHQTDLPSPTMQSSDPLSDWGTLHFERSFRSSRGRSAGSVCAGDSAMYPLAQAGLNLRALWLLWVASNAGTSYDAARLDPEVSVGAVLQNPQQEAGATAPVRLLARWLEKWAGKRRSSQSRNSTQSKQASRSSSRQSGGKAAPSSAGKRAPASTTKRRGRRRIREDSSDDSSEEEEEAEEAEEDLSEDEGEWSAEEDDDLQDSSDEEVFASRGRRSTATSTSTAQQGADGADEDEGEVLTNVMVLEGPSGSGKSAAVHDCARRLGIRVIEVNASQKRSGPEVKKFIAEASQSVNISENLGGAQLSDGVAGSAQVGGTAGISLILFDEVDIVFEEEGDAQLYSAIQQIAGASKCPILLTTERPLPFFKALHAKCVKFSRPSCSDDTAFHALVAAAAADALLSPPTTVTAASRAVASLFAPKATVKPTAVSSASVPVPPPAASKLSAQEELELRTLCALCDGDTRSALATLQCLPGKFFLSSGPSAAGNGLPSAVVDLTGSPTSTRAPRNETVRRPAQFREFSAFLQDAMQLSFARWDEPLPLFGIAAEVPTPISVDAGPSAVPGILIPVVQEVSPRTGLCSGGFTVVIRGANFLQPDRDGATNVHDDGIAAASVRVLLNGVIPCPCVLRSDSCIVAYVPAVERQGVYVFVVEVQAHRAGRARPVVARSDISGVGAAWIQLLCRNFPPLPPALTRCSSASSFGVSGTAGAVEVRTTPAVHSDSGAETEIDRSQQNTPTAELFGCPATDGRKAAVEQKGNGKKIVLGKRLRKISKQVACDSEDDFNIASDEEVFRASKRKTRALAEDGGSDQPDCSSGASTPVAASQDNCDGDAALPALVEQDFAVLGEKLLNAMRAALSAVLESSLCDPFLEPVSDLIAPGYSATVDSPMDLGTIQASLNEQLYAPTGETAEPPGLPDVAAFVGDVRQVWRNCVQYNGATSPLVRTAYMLSFLFESTLRSEVELAVRSFHALQWEIDGRDSYAVRCASPVLTLLTVPASSAFDACAKLSRSMSAPKMLALLAESRRELQAEAPMLSEEQALGPERVSYDELRQELIKVRAARENAESELSARGLGVPGLRNTNTSALLSAGLEYEWEDSPAVGSLFLALQMPGPKDHEDLSALQRLSSAGDRACDADVLSAASLLAADASANDDPLDSAHRTYAPYGSCSTAVSAPCLDTGYTFASYSRCLSGAALACTARPTHAPSSSPFSLLRSPYLQHELRRLEFARQVFGVVSSYVGRSSTRGGAVACLGLIGQETMTSLSFVPSSLALDVVPALSAMCRAEKENDADAMDLLATQAQEQPDQPFKAPASIEASRRKTVRLICGSSRAAASAAATAGTRLTRRSLTGSAPHRHECFTYMKSRLSTHNTKVFSGLADCYNNLLGAVHGK